jgi:hypothetical protein
MKKVWNVYQDKNGERKETIPNSINDIYYQHTSGYTFLGQITEEPR